MIWDKTTTAPCIIAPPEPPDPRCEQADYALQHPSCRSALILKPGVATLCLLDSVNYSLFELIAGVETELTSGVSFTSSDPTVFAIGTNSGSGTAIGAGTAIITANYGTRAVQATITTQAEATCCEEVTVSTAIVVDNSLSMSLAFAGYGSRLSFAKAVASNYGGLIAEVDGLPKDSVGVWSVNSTLTQLLAPSQDTAAVLAAIAAIPQTQQKTDLLTVFTVVAPALLASGADNPVLFLIGDCEQTLPADRQPVLDAAFAFKQAGGIVAVFATRASGVLQGFDLAERIATGGFFINGKATNAATGLQQLSYLKKLLCAGPCVDPGDRYENQPALTYSSFLNWEVVDGVVNLLGPGLKDFLPGNGLYVELAGQSHAMIRTINTFDIVAGHEYLIHFKAAGNQQSLSAAQSISASIRVGDTKIFEQTVFPAWNAAFSDYNFTFTALYDATVRLYFEQNYAGTETPGSLLDDVVFTNETTDTTLLADNFDEENLTYIPPACGLSSALAAIDDPEAPTVEWLNDAGDDLNHIGQFTYGITYVTNEGETAVTTVLYQRLDGDAFSETVRRLNLPQPVPERVVSINIWRSIGEGDAGPEAQNNDLFLLAEVTPTTTAYLDSEDAAAFTARYEPSVEAPTVNTTEIAEGGLGYGYGYAPCCYYSETPGTDGESLIPAMTSNTEPSGFVISSASSQDSGGEGAFFPFAGLGEGNTCWNSSCAAGAVTDAPSYLQCEIEDGPKIVRSYQMASHVVPESDLSGPAAWVLEGSNNGVDWTEVDSQVGVSGWIDYELKTFTVTTPGAYSWYRISFTEVEDQEGIIFCVQTLALIGGTPDEILFVNNCPPCLEEVPGVQVAESPGLADIESGSTPPPVFTCFKAVDVGCPVGFVNSPTANIVPVMISATAPSGTVISSAGAAVGFEAWRVFDNDAGTYMDLVGVIAGYVGYHNTVTKIATSYKITARSDYTLGSPKNWTFEGSNDGSTWTVLDTRSSIGWFAGQTQTFAFTNAASFTYYRLNVTSNASGNVSSNLSLASLEIFGSGAATAHGEATGTGSTNDAACADATAKATVIAQTQLTCVRVYTATVSVQRTPCPLGTYGGSAFTASASATSYNSQREAIKLATQAARALADAGRDCTQSNNDQKITIADNAIAVSYPSVKYVSGFVGVISKVTVTLCGLTHASPDDLQMLLVSPGGSKVKLWQNAGGTTAISNATIILDDDAGAALPDTTAIVAGTYRPANYSPGTALQMISPAPAVPYEQLLSAFDGEDPNGSWSLWIFDDLAIGAGQLACGWDLTIT